MENAVFKLDSYLNESDAGAKPRENESVVLTQTSTFKVLCDAIQKDFDDECENDISGFDAVLERQKKAIIGFEKEVRYFKDKIDEYIKLNQAQDTWYPQWYRNLTDAIFHENWGIAGVAEWVDGDNEALKGSSSAKIIGDRIYFLIDGTLELQPQKIDALRRRQLRKALLLKTPNRRLSSDYHEVYMLNGIRITIYGDGKTKEDQDTIVLRKFFVKDYSFDKQVELGTIPKDAVPLFKAMIKSGFNVAFTGAVRTAKTTFLTTWQSYENRKLEGVSIETDPEIPFHKIMPEAPILQLVADGEDLEKVVKSIMRSDADYIILGEARDGVALNTAVRIANKGTRRVKMTYHCTDSVDFCYDIADEIVKTYGGSLYSTILKVAKSFQFIFQFTQLSDKSQKRLKGIYEVEYSQVTHEVTVHQICRYVYETDSWVWKGQFSESSIVFGTEEDDDAMRIAVKALEKLGNEYPESRSSVFKPAYDHLKAGV